MKEYLEIPKVLKEFENFVIEIDDSETDVMNNTLLLYCIVRLKQPIKISKQMLFQVDEKALTDDITNTILLRLRNNA
jgi:hypothetical protein